MKKVLVIAVHPDDETVGCGGSLLRHKLIGDAIYWLIVTNRLPDNEYSESRGLERKNEIEFVSEKYGFDKIFKLDLPTTKLDEIPMLRIITGISNVLQEIRPEIIYIPNRSDVHSDHRIVFQAAISCSKNFRSPFIEKLLMMETLSETEFAPATNENAFIPNVFVNITEFIDKKIDIVNIYKSEIMPGNMPRSINAIKALAAYRGSRIGVNFAESFQLIFERV